MQAHYTPPDWFVDANLPLSRGTLVRDGAQFLQSVGIDAPTREARLILGIALGLEQAVIFGHPEVQVLPANTAAFSECLRRRAAGEPLSRLRGEREFWSLPFKLSKATLDPRPDSECLIEAVLHHLPHRETAWRILDLGTGTGCLLLAVLSEYLHATGLGVDRAQEALDTAQANAATLHLSARAQWQRSHWGEDVQGVFDIVLSNPPYIPTSHIAKLAPEVRQFDPLLALDGGEDGLACYRQLVPDIKRLLAPLGLAFIEFGQGQAQAVADICRAEGLFTQACFVDGAGRERGLVLRNQSLRRD